MGLLPVVSRWRYSIRIELHIAIWTYSGRRNLRRHVEFGPDWTVDTGFMIYDALIVHEKRHFRAFQLVRKPAISFSPLEALGFQVDRLEPPGDVC